MRSYGLVSILNAVLLSFITLYPILFVITYAAMHPTNLTLLGFIASALNIITFLALAGFETHTISGKIGASALLYPLGSIFFISAIVSTSIKVSLQKEITWKDSGYVLSLQV